METKERLLREHIRVLKKSYDNIVRIMEEDIEVKADDKGVEKITLKDDKIKVYAEGLRKSAETLNYLFAEIKNKEDELDKLLHPNKKNEKKEEETSKKYPNATHLK